MVGFVFREVLFKFRILRDCYRYHCHFGFVSSWGLIKRVWRYCFRVIFCSVRVKVGSQTWQDVLYRLKVVSSMFLVFLRSFFIAGYFSIPLVVLIWVWTVSTTLICSLYFIEVDYTIFKITFPLVVHISSTIKVVSLVLIFIFCLPLRSLPFVPRPLTITF